MYSVSVNENIDKVIVSTKLIDVLVQEKLRLRSFLLCDMLLGDPLTSPMGHSYTTVHDVN